MEINRNNYELFFLDYKEGNLQPEMVAELMVFLEENPDLEEELENFEHIALSDKRKVIFHDKDSLKKTITATAHINEVNYEDYFIADMEGDLEESTKKEVQEFIRINPILRKENELTYKAVLQPESAIIFPAKNLMKQTPVISINRRRVYAYASVAASIAIALTVWYQFTRNANMEGNLVLARQINTIKKTERVVVKEQETAIAEINEAPTIIKKKLEQPLIEETALYAEQTNKTTQPTTDSARFESTANKNLIVNNQDKEQEEENILDKSIADNLTEKKNVQHNPQQEDEGYLSLKQFIVKKIKDKVLDTPEQVPGYTQLALIDVVDAGTKGINKMLGTGMKIDRKYDNNGELIAYAFSSGKFSFAREVKKK